MSRHMDRYTQSGKSFKSPRAYRRWLKRQNRSSTPANNPATTRAGLEALEQRTLLSASPVFELSDLLGSNGGDGSQGVIINGVSLGDNSGVSVSSAGDINGDGLDDIIIGAYLDGPNGTSSGASFVVFGKAGGFNASLNLSSLNGSNGFRINGVAAGDQSGRAVARAGDINGDGFDDLLIGSYTASPNGTDSGQAYVIYGKGTAFSSSLELSSLNGSDGFTIDGLSAGDLLGFDLAGLGDVNGDGIDDFVIGAYGNNANAGAAYVVFGQNGFGSNFDLATLNGSNGFVVLGDSGNDFLGITVGSAGDINGDGLSDVVVGAHGDGTNGANSGSAYVVFGSTSAFASSINVSTLNGSNGFAVRGEAASDNAGRSVGNAGDFNGDGYDDLLIGAPRATGSAADSGAAYIIYGQGGAFSSSLDLSTLNGSNGFKINGTDAGDRTGLRVSYTGDVNGDGLDDVVIAARRSSPNGVRSGKAFVLFGQDGAAPASVNLNALTGADGFVLNGIDAQDLAGDSVNYAGDVNGDGFADFLIGASGADPSGAESGETYLIFGGDFSDAITHLGSQFADGLTGNGNANVMNGRRGDDIITGNGGADVILGGQGDDQAVVSDLSFMRVDGGSGLDTLKLDGTGLALDLTTLPDSRLINIEAIDIRGGSNTLTLNQREVLNISSSSNTLRVIYDNAGTVNIGAGWSQAGSQVVDGNIETTYTQGNATLVLVEEADVVDPVVTVDPVTTTSRSPELTGTVVDLDPSVVVQVTVNGQTYAAVNNGDGTWTLAAGTISPDLADGVYDVQVTGTDSSSNVGNDQTTGELIIDNTDPVVTVDELYTNDDSPELTGTIDDLDPATTISVNVNGNDYAATNNGDGTWTLAAGQISPALAEGVYDVTVTATDTNGHSASDASSNELTIDTTAPVVTINEPGTVDTLSPELTGTVVDVDTEALIEVRVNSVDYTATNNGDGTWTLAAGEITGLSEGTFTLDVRVTDAAGNQGFIDAPIELDVDTPPVVTVDPISTSSQSPELTGTITDSDTSATVEVTVNGNTYTATNNGDGTWTLAAGTIAPALADGTYDVSVSATDSGNNTGTDDSTDELVIDSSAPTVTIDTLSTSDDTPELTGTVSSTEAVVEVTVDGNTYTATNNGDGTWTLADDTITTALAEGTYDVSVTASNLADPPAVGSDATTDELTIDQTDPVVGLDTLAPTGDATPEITGTITDADPNTVITVIITGGGAPVIATNNGDGTWTVPNGAITTPLAPGTYDITVTATDSAGNLGSVVVTDALEILDQAFTITVDPLTTNDRRPQITGTIDDPNATVKVIVNLFTHEAVNNGDGTWTLPDNTIFIDLPDGVYNVRAIGTNENEVEIEDDSNNELTIETVAPVVTVNGKTTIDGTPGLSGTVDDADAVVEVTVNGNTYTATNNGDGTWTLADDTISPALAVGTYNVSVTATDIAGNIGSDASTDELVILDPSTGTIHLSDLLAANGGDGSEGTVFYGVNDGDRAGNWAASAGDINGDGFDDIIIGAPNADNNGENSGSAYIIFGQAAGFPATFDLSTLNGTNGFRVDGLSSWNLLGIWSASAGDMNGDGLDDLVIGADNASPNGYQSGHVFVIYGKDTAFSSTFDLTTLDGTNGFRFDGEATGDRSGFAVDTAGDINGDGLSDIIIGSLNGDDGVVIDGGRSYVIFGSTAAMPAIIEAGDLTGANGFILTGPDAGGSAGFNVSGGFDINGDGFGDLVIGAPSTTVGGNAEAGKVFVVFGKESGFSAELNLSTLDGSNGFVITGDAAGQQLGYNVGSIGDFNGDGFGDIILGSPEDDAAGDTGSAYVVFGHGGAFSASMSIADLNGTNGFKLQGTDAGDEAGVSVSGAGDINGDGLDDLIVGAMKGGGDSPFDTERGEAYIMFGTTQPIAATVTLDSLQSGGGVMIFGIDNGDEAGRSVNAAGDVNGDGFADLLVTAREGDIDPNDNTGEAYLIYGRDFYAQVTHTGTGAGETIDGTAGDDAIVAGAGDDDVNANGGQDAVNAGQGDDTVSVSDNTFVRVNGGNGTDTLHLDGAGITLDLTALSDYRLTGIEIIDTRGSGANSLTLNVREVLNLSGTSNTLLILQNPDDTVDIGTGWSSAGIEDIDGKTFNVFTQGNATVKIFTDADSTAPVVTVDTLDTNDATPELTGTVDDPTATVEVTVNGQTYTATNNGDGTWTLADDTITPALAEGTYDVSVTATDTNSNVGTDATSTELTVDLPPVVTIDSLTTTDTTPELTGTISDSDPATVIQVIVDTQVYEATNNGDGTWTLADDTISPALGYGTYDVFVIATDPGEQIGNDGTTDELVIQENVLPGDANNDGFVGVDDLNIILIHWNQNVTPGDISMGDLTGEGFVGVDDLNIVLVNWNNGTPPAAEPIATSMPQEQTTQAPADDADVSDGDASVLDEVQPQQQRQQQAQRQSQQAQQQQQAAAWSWMQDDARQTSLFDSDDDTTTSALDLAQPMQDQSSVSRL